MNDRKKVGLVRPAGFAEDYLRAARSERLEAEDHEVPTAEDVAETREDFLERRYASRGKATRVVRRPHARALLGSQNLLAAAELRKLEERYAASPDQMSDADLDRLRTLNEIVSRNLRAELEQLKFEGDPEEMPREEMIAALRAQADALESGE